MCNIESFYFSNRASFLGYPVRCFQYRWGRICVLKRLYASVHFNAYTVTPLSFVYIIIYYDIDNAFIVQNIFQNLRIGKYFRTPCMFGLVLRWEGVRLHISHWRLASTDYGSPRVFNHDTLLSGLILCWPSLKVSSTPLPGNVCMIERKNNNFHFEPVQDLNTSKCSNV